MTLEKKPIGLGCNVGDPDDRDHLYAAAPTVIDTPIFPIDLRSDTTTIRNQGDLGACTAFGVTELFDFVRKKNNLTNWLPSPLFTYFATRRLTLQAEVDSGASVRNALKSTVTSGVTMEKTWPYDITKFAEMPPQQVWDDAVKHQTLEYLKLDDTNKNNFVKCLNEGYPFVFGLQLYQSFMSLGMRAKGIIPIPDKTKEKLIGGHCMLAVGYRVDDDGKEYMIVQNSWGKYWGDKGYCYIPMEYFYGVDSYDFWTIRLTETCDTDVEDDNTPDPVPTPDPVVPPTPEPVVPVVTPTPEPTPTPPVVPPEPTPVPPIEPPISLWKNPRTYIIILIAVVAALFVLIR